MDSGEWDEQTFFAALQASGARVLLIGRQALIALGIPVLTADYDLWVHIDDIDALNVALRPLELFPNHDALQARQRGRYVLEGDQHVDVMVARAQTTKDGQKVHFDEVWARREPVVLYEEISVAVPCIDDLIATKRWAMRPKDIPDIQYLEALRRERGAP